MSCTRYSMKKMQGRIEELLGFLSFVGTMTTKQPEDIRLELLNHIAITGEAFHAAITKALDVSN